MKAKENPHQRLGEGLGQLSSTASVQRGLVLGREVRVDHTEQPPTPHAVNGDDGRRGSGAEHAGPVGLGEHEHVEQAGHDPRQHAEGHAGGKELQELLHDDLQRISPPLCYSVLLGGATKRKPPPPKR